MSERFKVSTVGERSRNYGSVDEDDYDGKNVSNPSSRQGSVKSSHSSIGAGNPTSPDKEKQLMHSEITNGDGGLANPSLTNGNNCFSIAHLLYAYYGTAYIFCLVLLFIFNVLFSVFYLVAK